MIRNSFIAGLSMLAAFASPARAEIYATVVGIDDYAFQSGLDGAVNDARDLASALEGRGADVKLLTDEDASRSAVVRAVRQQMSKARAGDVVVFSFAGHGIQMPESLAGDEIDGKDENFVFHGFEQSGPGAGERLRDNDVALLLNEAPPGVSVLFIADSCHSGTMTRAPAEGTSLGKTRFLELGPIEDDPLPPPDRESFQLEASDMPHVVFAAAARDDEVTPEVTIDDQRRGALSWSVARAIERGLVDDGGNGGDVMGAFREYVRAQVRAHSGARQTPDVVFTGGGPFLCDLFGIQNCKNPDTEIAVITPEQSPSVPQTPKEPTAPAKPPQMPASDLVLSQPAPPPLAVRGAEASLVLQSMTKIVPEAEAKLIWDTNTGQLLDKIAGDMIAEIQTEGDLIGALGKWSTQKGLQEWAPLRAFDMRLKEGDRLHKIGEKVHIVISQPEVAPRKGHITIFNLASRGEVQYIFPSPKSVELGEDVVFREQTEMVLGPSTVEDPIGADYLIAVLSRERPDALRAALNELSGTRSATKVLKILSDHAQQPGAARIATLPIITGR